MAACLPFSFPLPFGYNPSVPTVGEDTYIVTHFQDGKARLIEQYREKPRIEDLTGILMGQVQALETALWQLFVERSIDTAVFAQLDVLGNIVGAERQDLTDSDFLALIRATIRANVSEGTTPDIYAIVTAGLGDDSSGLAKLRFYPPAGFIITILNPPLFDGEILHGLITRGTAAGVRGITVISDEPVATRLRFSRAVDFPTFRAASGFDHFLIPATGTGSFTRALDERTA